MPTVLHDIALAGDAGARRARRQQRDAVPRDDARRQRHGPGRRPDRGAQGHRRPPGAARLHGRATTSGRPSTCPRSWPRPGRSTPSTSSTRWGTCDRRRPARGLDGRRRASPGKGEPLEHRVRLRRHPRTRSTRSAAATSTARCASRRPTAPADRDDGHRPRVAHHRGARRHRRAAHRRPSPSCADPSVLGRTFYLMGFVDGWSPMNADGWPAPFDTDLEARAGPRLPAGRGHRPAVARSTGRPRASQDLGRPDGFHERQVDRWTAFLERIKGRELPGFDEASAWLRAHRPIDYVPGLMHGDYQFANVMYRARRAGPAGRDRRLGDGHGRRPEARPRLGGAELARGHRRRPSGDRRGYVDMTGMPSRDEVLAHYAEVSGRQVDDIDYYVVLAKWKLAVVLEQGFQRAGDDEKLQAFGPIVLDLMQGAAELAETTDYAVTAEPVAVRAAVCRAYGAARGGRGRGASRRPTAAPARCGSGVARRGGELPRRAARRRRVPDARCRRRSCPAASSPAWSREVADDVDDVAVGDRVTGTGFVGAFAEEVVVARRAPSRRIPDRASTSARRRRSASPTAPPYHVLRSVGPARSRARSSSCSAPAAASAWPPSSSARAGRDGDRGGVVATRSSSVAACVRRRRSSSTTGPATCARRSREQLPDGADVVVDPVGRRPRRAGAAVAALGRPLRDRRATRPARSRASRSTSCCSRASQVLGFQFLDFATHAPDEMLPQRGRAAGAARGRAGRARTSAPRSRSTTSPPPCATSPTAGPSARSSSPSPDRDGQNG